ncbi:MAG: DsbA family protein [Gemmatimonadetes bacterium]|nr:DsbA family protein [Gemmatimonadota bacterium]
MSESNGKLERAMTMVLTLCAVLFAAILVKREFLDGNAPVTYAERSTVPERVGNWDELLANGIALRSPGARVVVVEFADLECPACRQFHMRLDKAAADLNTEVGLVMLHFPLNTHRFAQPAARALECAAAAGAAARFVDVAYAKQDSFGLKPWTGYAAEAGVRDTVAFAACARDTAPVERVERGRRIGEGMDLRGTPMVIINGWRFPSPPSDTQLRGAIKALIAGKPPPKA